MENSSTDSQHHHVSGDHYEENMTMEGFLSWLSFQLNIPTDCFEVIATKLFAHQKESVMSVFVNIITSDESANIAYPKCPR